MRVKLSENIRAMRLKREWTQEHLAERLGVSPQAVSRWEKAGGYPDIELLPALAAAFNVTVDKLLGVDHEDEAEQQKWITQLEKSARILDSKQMLAETAQAVAAYPNNFLILFFRIVAIQAAACPRNCPLPQDERTALLREGAALGRRLLKETDEDMLRTSVKPHLILILHSLGERAEAIQIARTMPTIEYTQEFTLYFLLEGDARIAYISNRMLSAALTLSQLSLAADHLIPDKMPSIYEYSPEEVNRFIPLYDLAYGGSNPAVAEAKWANPLYAVMRLLAAKYGAAEMDMAAAREHLEAAVKGCAAVDARLGQSDPIFNWAYLKNMIQVDPQFALSQEETVAHNFSYAVYHGYIEHGWLELPESDGTCDDVIGKLREQAEK